MQHHESHFIAQDRMNIYYQSWLPDDNPRAIFLIVHGLGDHSSRFRNYVDAFVPKGYALYALDLRGHGRSGGRRGHVDRFDDYVSDVRQLHTRMLDAHPGIKVILLGHSLGSLIALTYGLRDSSGLTGMIASGTAIRDALNVPGWLRSATGVVGKVLPALTLNNGVKTEYLSHDPKVVAAYNADPLVHHVGSVRLAAEVDLVRAELLRRAPEWKLPLLMLHGGDDPICLVSGAQSFYDKTPHALVEYRQYVGLYHEIHNEIGKELVFKDIETWLAGRV